MNQVPSELIQHLAQFAHDNDMLTVLLVCKHWYHLLHNCKIVFAHRCSNIENAPNNTTWCNYFFQNVHIIAQTDTLLQSFEKFEKHENTHLVMNVRVCGPNSTRVILFIIHKVLARAHFCKK